MSSDLIEALENAVWCAINEDGYRGSEELAEAMENVIKVWGKHETYKNDKKVRL